MDEIAYNERLDLSHKKIKSLAFPESIDLLLRTPFETHLAISNAMIGYGVIALLEALGIRDEKYSIEVMRHVFGVILGGIYNDFPDKRAVIDSISEK